jgi:hypothetical protein
VKVVEQIDEIFVAIVLASHAERLIETSADGVANHGQEPEGAHIGRFIGTPHAPNKILIAENEFCGHGLQIPTGLLQSLTKNEGVQFGHGSQKLNCRIGIAGVAHVLKTHHTFVTGILRRRGCRNRLGNRLRFRRRFRHLV